MGKGRAGRKAPKGKPGVPAAGGGGGAGAGRSEGWPGAPLAHLLGRGEGASRGPTEVQSSGVGFREAAASSPPVVTDGQVKGRDPGAQVSSSIPGRGGVGARTSGPGECPFGDVRSPLAAPPVPLPLALPGPAGARPRRPTYTRCAAPVRPHPPAAPASSPPLAPRPRADSPGSRGDSSTRSRPYGASTFCLGSVADSTGGNGLDSGDRLCRPLVLGA